MKWAVFEPGGTVLFIREPFYFFTTQLIRDLLRLRRLYQRTDSYFLSFLSQLRLRAIGILFLLLLRNVA